MNKKYFNIFVEILVILLLFNGKEDVKADALTLTSIPKEGSEYAIVGYECTNGSNITWNKEEGSILITNTTSTDSCELKLKDTHILTLEKNGATSVGADKLSCVPDENNSCTVTLPSITRSGWTIVGWSEEEDSLTEEHEVGDTLTLTEDTTLYAITSYKFTRTFKPNGTSTKETTLSCTMYNIQESCTMTSPKITRDGWESIGWNSNPNATKSTANTWEHDSLRKFTKAQYNQNGTLYAITSKDVTVTFNGNGATIGSKSEKCTMYNKDTSCSITSPSINRTGWETIGWNTSSTATTSTWDVNTTENFSSNAKYYAITKEYSYPTIKITFGGGEGTTSKVYSSVSCTAGSGTVSSLIAYDDTSDKGTCTGSNSSCSITLGTSGNRTITATCTNSNGKTTTETASVFVGILNSGEDYYCYNASSQKCNITTGPHLANGEHRCFDPCGSGWLCAGGKMIDFDSFVTSYKDGVTYETYTYELNNSQNDLYCIYRNI